MLQRVTIKPWVFITGMTLGLLDVLTTLYALNTGNFVEGNPASLMMGDAWGPIAMCLLGFCATLVIVGFTANIVPLPARVFAYILLAVKALVVSSNFIHILFMG